MTSFIRKGNSDFPYPAGMAAFFLMSGQIMAETPPPTFRLLDALMHNREMPPEILARGLGVRLDPSPGTSNYVSEVFEGGQSNVDPAISHVVLRLTRDGMDQDNLIALGIDTERSCITLRDIVSYYGNFSGMHVPTPRQPPTAAVTYSYRQDWGRLVFEIARKDPACLKGIRLEYR